MNSGEMLCAFGKRDAESGRSSPFQQAVRRMIGVSLHLLPVVMALASTCFGQDQTGVHVDTGDTAWVLISSALVLLMTAPGLALFYGGMARQKNTLSTIMH